MRPLVWTQFAIGALIVGAMAVPVWAQSATDKPTADQSETPTTVTTVTPIPVAVDPPPAPPNPAVLTGMNWVERPTGQDFARNYPHDAIRNNIEGRVVLDCLVGADGRLSCAVISENPPGHGFGDASLRISREFRAARKTVDGRST
ncbi:MAG TPA: energy transducer TonB, partial [Candidatus Binatia bacterium]|nr:energy transducer TonB [Candidatus Binatia bacterium]